MTNQEIFDKVCRHLKKQNTVAMSVYGEKGYPSCSYKNEKGLKCAVGCLIPDELYNKKFEGCGVENLLSGVLEAEFKEVLKRIGINPKSQIKLLKELQACHDSVGLELFPQKNKSFWERVKPQLSTVASHYGLNSEILK